jgi:endonuclease YncB( thermonuclease family)
MNKLGVVTVALLAVISASAYADILGTPRIIDGDTIAFGDQRVRFFGIDAPESKQTCRNGEAARYACGLEATEALRRPRRGDPSKSRQATQGGGACF